MRRVTRQALPAPAQRYLEKRQAHADDLRQKKRLDVEAHWKSSRSTQAVQQVLATLHAMAGPRQRCMYCLDSHGSDIEHFRPKAAAPQRLYAWSNHLLCCTHCGRIKGNQFPMQGRRPLLVDPSREDPWAYLDLDPTTGNLTARFNLSANDWSAKGQATVDVLKLDQREALARGYLKTLTRMSRIVAEALTAPAIDGPTLVNALRDADDHGLAGWCFGAGGQTTEPFSQLVRLHPAVWRRCRRELAN